jgi:hypothetical protein
MLMGYFELNVSNDAHEAFIYPGNEQRMGQSACGEKKNSKDGQRPIQW